MGMKSPKRTWLGIMSLVAPLTVVGIAAMAISYVTLIDVARVNGMPLPELFPILIDVGTVACMVAAAQFRTLGLNGRALAHTTFAALSAISVFANATHAVGAADLSATTVGVAVVLAATPPAALLAITHLVMRLVPDAKERERISAVASATRVTATSVTHAATYDATPNDTTSATRRDAAPVARHIATAKATPTSADVTSQPATSTWQVDARIREAVTRGVAPSGREVGEWLGGKSARTGQRYLASFVKRHESDIKAATA